MTSITKMADAGNDTRRVLELKTVALEALTRGDLAAAVRTLTEAIEALATPRRLAIFDARGNERIILGGANGGQARIDLLRFDGEEGARLEVTDGEDGTLLYLQAHDTAAEIEMHVYPDGESQIQCHRMAGGNLIIGVDADGTVKG